MITKRQPHTPFQKRYLIFYNLACLCVWLKIAQAVFLDGKTGLFAYREESGLARFFFWLRPSPVEKLWESTALWLIIAHCLALLECIHPFFKLTRSSPLTCAMQVLSRLHIVVLLWRLCPASRSDRGFLTTLIAWTSVELIRYPFYALTVFSADGKIKVPHIFTWIRYSAFIILYPIGIVSEMHCIWKGLPALRRDSALRSYPIPMPNRLNFEVDLYIFYALLLIGYIPASIHLFTHMLRQRSKALAPLKND